MGHRLKGTSQKPFSGEQKEHHCELSTLNCSISTCFSQGIDPLEVITMCLPKISLGLHTVLGRVVYMKTPVSFNFYLVELPFES